MSGTIWRVILPPRNAIVVLISLFQKKACVQRISQPYRSLDHDAKSVRQSPYQKRAADRLGDDNGFATE
jgi:hypothetical protein